MLFFLPDVPVTGGGGSTYCGTGGSDRRWGARVSLEFVPCGEEVAVLAGGEVEIRGVVDVERRGEQLVDVVV